MPANQSPYARHFIALDHFLKTHETLWRPIPFVARQLAWEEEYPELSHWLRQQSLEHAERYQNHPENVPAPSPFNQIATMAQQLSRLPQRDASPISVNRFFNVDIPGRKWAQINAFAGNLDFVGETQHWLDWCSGKGHLGRLLGHSGVDFTCIEYNAALVAEGQRLTQRLQLNGQHQHMDVTDECAAEHLHPQITPVALHACGDLHTHLLQLACSKGCNQLAIAPCCYNRIASESYTPLSIQAQNASLKLTKTDLRLPLAETVTAGARVRQQRDLSMARRLGFDLLQRELREIDNYLPIPSLGIEWLKKPFSRFCQDLAELNGIALPAEIAWDALEHRGRQRLAEVRNLELVRNLFRRPIEVWLILDRALFLEEHGYQVTISEFCSPELTPRNILILAERILS
ncbi:MAG: methyltransferase [Hahellaceae bacterium]|nr:methyltransferase [Hahellaceae bacterium]MCP5170049.1 methyltransferase [Hahellaceae bacterium]